MDLVTSLTQQKQAALLVLPKADMFSASKEVGRRSNSQLFLLQLPESLLVDDFNPNVTASSVVTPQSCCLVHETKGSSFDLIKLETSNSLIMIPPSMDSNLQPPPNKKPKMDAVAGIRNCPAQCRLLKAGGSGASFLELRERKICLKSMFHLLQSHLFDPYTQNYADTPNAWQGVSLETLASDLMISQQQTKEGLRRLHALALVKESGISAQCRYGQLGEEALLEAQCALVATLAECNQFEAYAKVGVPLESLIEESIKRMSETYPYIDQVLRHCVKTYLLHPECRMDDISNGRQEKGLVRLDVKMVATCVVKCLFLKQTEPWEEKALLLRWQRDLPGVGENYQVSIDLLRGMAIRSQKLQNRWKFFSAHQLPLEPEGRFQALFQEQDVWSADELEPYLQPLLEDTNKTMSELLQRYTKVANGETTMRKMYCRR